MNTAVKSFSNNHMPEVGSISLRTVLFHSTPVSDRRRGTHWDSGFGSSRNSSKRYNGYAKRVRRMGAKESLLRNVSAYAECLFQSWKAGDDENDHTSYRDTSWFRQQYWANGSKKSSYGPRESRRETRWSGRKRSFQFCCSDDEEVETIFHSAFGGGRYFYRPFNDADNFQRRNTSNYYNYSSSWNWRCDDGEDEDDTSTDCNSSDSDLASDRRTLGLSASGPLKLEDVKNAYRASALRWHPDRHQGPSKVAAEQKFKQCSAAYQSLCDKFAVD